ncbi:MAG: PAS domain S-box protein [Verrucomicrobia bacterium]|nr:PAS domain S-box protein [Verrucomicrobiota bacterium]
MTSKASPRTPAAPEPDSARALRARAEKTIKDKPVPPPENPAGMSAHEMQRVIHELRVHQIEVEAQNEGLQRQQAEQAAGEARNADLKESLRIKSLAFDSAINAKSIANTEGILTEANDAFLRNWGYSSKEEVIGKPIPHFLQDPKDAAAIIATLDETGFWEGSYVATRKDGSSFIAHGLATSMRDELGEVIGYQSSVLDITERRQTEAALQASEARYREIFELAVDGILQGGPGCIITGANAQMLKLAGRSLHQILGLHVSMLFSSEELATVPLWFDLLNKNWPLDVECSLLRPDGTRVPVEMHSKMMPDGTYQTISRDITERKHSEDALRESEHKYRMLHESMMDAFVSVDMTGRFLDSNPAYREMTGYSEDELRRLTYSDITPESWHAIESRVVAEQVIPLGYSNIYQKEYRRKDGKIIPVELRTCLIRDADGTPAFMWAIIRDITIRQQAEQTLQNWSQTLERQVAERTEELQQSEARFRFLAETTFEGIAFSEGGRLIDGNAQLGKILGYELAEMIGRPVMDFVAPESRATVAETISSMEHETIYECLSLRKDGTVVPTEAHGRMVIWHGKRLRVTVLRDLTESKRLAATIQAKQAEIERAKRLVLISEISAGIIHQISQPLSSAGTNLAVAIAKMGGCAQPHCNSLGILDEVQGDVTRMREIVIHLRALVHPERPDRTRTDLNRLVAEVLPLLQREAGIHQIHLKTILAPDLPPLLADAVQLKQVVLSLVRNGFDACVEFPPVRRVVAISTRALPGQKLELCVRDAGIGIAPSVEERLFDLFFTTKKEGLGIGLRLCRTIVEAHGGLVEADNNPDRCGAVFRVLLPAES